MARSPHPSGGQPPSATSSRHDRPASWPRGRDGHRALDAHGARRARRGDRSHRCSSAVLGGAALVLDGRLGSGICLPSLQRAEPPSRASSNDGGGPPGRHRTSGERRAPRRSEPHHRRRARPIPGTGGDGHAPSIVHAGHAICTHAHHASCPHRAIGVVTRHTIWSGGPPATGAAFLATAVLIARSEASSVTSLTAEAVSFFSRSFAGCDKRQSSAENVSGGVLAPHVLVVDAEQAILHVLWSPQTCERW